MREIPLSQGMVALVDDEDYEYLMQWKWTAITNHGNWYARRNTRGKNRTTVSMHQQIINGAQVDHADGNGLNNQRCNLRLCSNAQNCMNRRKRKDNCTGYKGVKQARGIQRWEARIYIANRYKHLGTFSSAELAALAYNKAAIQHFGDFARQNAIPDRGAS